jgi:hypothetical protein
MTQIKFRTGVFKKRVRCYNFTAAWGGIDALAAVAQSVEQRIRNAKVDSSIPSSGTRKSSTYPGSQGRALCFLAFM